MNDVQRTFYDNITNGILSEVDKVKMTTANLLSMIARLRQATACPSILTTEKIKSSKIEILKYRRKYITNLYKVKHGRFSCKSMKGDDIKLENSYVEYIEYTKNLNISDDCKVEKSVKVSQEDTVVILEENRNLYNKLVNKVC